MTVFQITYGRTDVDLYEVIELLEGNPSIEAAVESASSKPGGGAFHIYAIGVEICGLYGWVFSILKSVEMGYISKRKYVLVGMIRYDM